MTNNTLRPYREKALNLLSAVLTAEWGDRCPRFEAGCASCLVWAAFDMLERITESSTLDDPRDFERVKEQFSLDADDPK